MPLPQVVAPITLDLLPLDHLGPHVDHGTGQVQFGVLLPLVGDQATTSCGCA